MNSWLLLQDVQNGAERNRFLHVVKSRGMAHSNQMREFLLTDHGVELLDVYVGPSGLLLAGSARGALEAQEQAQAVVREQETAGRKRGLERKRQALETQIAALRAEYEIEEAELQTAMTQGKARGTILAGDRVEMGRQRQSDSPAARKAVRL